MTDIEIENIQQMQQELERLRLELKTENKHVVFLNDTLTKVSKAASFMHEEPYRTMLGLSFGDNILIQGTPELKLLLDKTMQEVNRLRNENAFLRRELRPPEAEKKELKYWIVTWLDRWSLGYKFESEAIAEWPNVLKRKAELEPRPGVSHIRILEQIVYV